MRTDRNFPVLINQWRLVSPIRKMRIASPRVYMRGALASVAVVVVAVMFLLLERCAQLCDAPRGYREFSALPPAAEGAKSPLRLPKWPLGVSALGEN
jgi:hypothetical protein